jgi:hypothetical protein
MNSLSLYTVAQYPLTIETCCIIPIVIIGNISKSVNIIENKIYQDNNQLPSKSVEPTPQMPYILNLVDYKIIQKCST